MELVCEICKRGILNEDQNIFCINCDSPFHFDHLKQWTIKNSKCPVCKKPFHFTQMQKLRYTNPAVRSQVTAQKSRDERAFDRRIQREWEESQKTETPYFITFGVIATLTVLAFFLLGSVTSGIISLIFAIFLGVLLLRNNAET